MSRLHTGAIDASVTEMGQLSKVDAFFSPSVRSRQDFYCSQFLRLGIRVVVLYVRVCKERGIYWHGSEAMPSSGSVL